MAIRYSYSSARNEYMIVRMKRMLERTVWALTQPAVAGDFRPSAYEQRFANGKIDRVDTCAGKGIRSMSRFWTIRQE